jgi:hypothetical protein
VRLITVHGVLLCGGSHCVSRVYSEIAMRTQYGIKTWGTATLYPESLTLAEKVKELTPSKEKDILESMSPSIFMEIFNQMPEHYQWFLAKKIMALAKANPHEYCGVWIGIEILAGKDAEKEILKLQ